MKSFYRIYDQKGRYNHSYQCDVEGASGWAWSCAKHIGGVLKMERGEESETIFDARKTTSK